MNSIKTVAVTGSAGFVGRAVVRALLAAGYSVRALVRTREKARKSLPTSDQRLTLVAGDAADPAVAAQLLQGAHACINLIGIIRQAPGATFVKAHVRTTEVLIAAAASAGCKRFLQMSALGVGHDGDTEYRRTKWDAELIVRSSGLDWTIFRPSMIHGASGEFIQTAASWATGKSAPWFFLPYFSRRVPDPTCPSGTAPEVAPVIAPIAVEDVAAAFVKAVSTPESIGEIYNLAGPEILSWPDLLTLIRDSVPGAKHNLRPWPIPGDVAAIGAKVAGLAGLGWALPFDEGMAVMGSSDSAASMDKVRADLGIEAKPFTSTFRAYAASL